MSYFLKGRRAKKIEEKVNFFNINKIDEKNYALCIRISEAREFEI